MTRHGAGTGPRRPSAARRRSREAALQVLFALDVAGWRSDPEKVFEAACGSFELPEGARPFAKELVNGVAANREALDELVGAHSTHWRVARMAAVDRNILRLAAYELAHAGTPVPVAIDEAVELARRFGDDRSPSFVNGILDAVAHTLGEGDS